MCLMDRLLFGVLQYPRLDTFEALRLMRFHFVLESEDPLHTGSHVGIERGAFLFAVFAYGPEAFVEGFFDEGPVAFVDQVLLAGIHYVGKAKDGGEQFIACPCGGVRLSEGAADG